MKLGKVSEACLQRSILRQIRTRREEVLSGAGIGADCAVFSFPRGRETAVCVQEEAVRPRGEETAVCGDRPGTVMTMAHLVQKAANNLAAGGAEPAAVLVSLLLPTTAEEADIRRLMAEAEERCGELDVEIAGGQTRVSAAVREPVATVTCVGCLWESAPHTAAAPGQDVVVSKWVGLQGTAYLAQRYREKLLARYPAYLVEEAAGFDRWMSVVPEARAAAKSGVCAMRDVSEGGIFGALWELAEASGVGLTIDMRKLPFRQETVEVCECCGVNPYRLLSGGCLLMTAEDGPGLVAALEAQQIPAVIVGKVTAGNDRILQNDGEIRYMERPQQDEIWKQ